MKKVKISAVSYLNTVPFVYGLTNSAISKHIDLSLDNPAVCASRLAANDAAIGLVPVAVIPQLPNYKIISNYCIGAKGKVRTVVLASNSPIESIKKVCLDNESRTSVLLSRILLHKYWKLSPCFEPIQSLENINPDLTETAYVLIGDKVFLHENKFKYIYDLAETWQQYRSLPFVFAAWTAVQPLSEDFVTELNQAFLYGLENIPAAIESRSNLPVDDQVAMQYLTEHIDYLFDGDKKNALVEFWNLALDEIKTKPRSC